MKKYIIAVSIAVVLVFVCLYLAMVRGLYLDIGGAADPEPVFRTEGKEILKKGEDGTWATFEIKGVDMSTSMPGGAVLDFEPDEEDYLRWMELIQDMGANTIRVYTVADADFYKALYEFNTANDSPIYILQGLQVSDQANYGSEDVYDDDFLDTLMENGVAAVDVVHGRRAILTGNVTGTGYYRWDVSQWVIGYLVGHEWDSGNVAYLNNSTDYPESYSGTYFKTSPDATRFEAVMAQVMDRITSYESNKYEEQRIIGFVNDPSNDPFEFTDLYAARFLKYSSLDAENVIPTEKLVSGYYAAYRLNYFSKDYLKYFTSEQKNELKDILSELDTSDIYCGYLDLLGKYHSIPVIAAGYGFSTSRVPVFEGEDPLNEREQGQSIVEVWQDAMNAGWAGVFISTWQDVWDRRTWNTSYATLDAKDPVWHDVQTEGQCYGLMEFSLGDGKPVCTIDGSSSEWTEDDMVSESDDGRIYVKYDEEYIYFYAESEDFVSEEDSIYIPVDTNEELGSTYCQNIDVSFERPADFVICIDGEEESRVMVQERYEILWAMHAYELTREDPYYEVREKNSPVFNPISVLIQRNTPVAANEWAASLTYETGKLRYGSADPESPAYDSLADFMFTENGVEIRIPWQLLNFATPSDMQIHEDYYENYGVEYTAIESMYVGMCRKNGREHRIPMGELALEGIENTDMFTERLKESYYIIREYWTES